MTTLLSSGHTESVLSVDVSSDGKLIASGGEGGEICAWSIEGTLLHKSVHPDTDCTSVCFASLSNNLYVSTEDKIIIYDIRNLSQPVETLSGNQEEINQLVLDEKEKFLGACDDSGEIKIFDLQEKRVYKTLRHKHTNICATACFRPKKPWEIFTGGLDSKLIHWDFSRPKCLNQYNMQELQSNTSDTETYMVNPPFLHHLAASKNGKYLVGALENGILAVFDSSRKNIREVFSLYAHSQGVSQVHFVSDTKVLSGGNDCSIVLWDLEKSVSTETENDGTQAPAVNGGSEAANGSTQSHDAQNESVSHACKVTEIQHTGKINWMKPFLNNGCQHLAIADQSSNVTIMPLSI
ncbi:hypothetical protein FSP39_013692 [Pinctada imbricata]|uniref:WD repeat-containing protein 53 n=1 Tax=Pinctada imbricata TaxID=66713 RepID=A0AA88Y035_PINIB|nr:hypothetical protein FSP39_013692 [Pinctada imbricata]